MTNFTVILVSLHKVKLLQSRFGPPSNSASIKEIYRHEFLYQKQNLKMVFGEMKSKFVKIFREYFIDYFDKILFITAILPYWNNESTVNYQSFKAKSF